MSIARSDDTKSHWGANARARLERMRFRRAIRGNALVLVLAATLVGGATGVCASLMICASENLHRVLFGLAASGRLSAMTALPAWRTLLVLMSGAIAVGATIWLWSKRAHEIVDPIEANALHGGRMSLTDSVFVAIQAVLSSGFGLSLGIEGGFTQLAGAVGSKVGRFLNRRRIDVRMLVGAGAAGGIAGAFDAPLAGAAYGFELVLGSYTVATLAPVVAAAIAGAFAARTLVGHTYRIPLEAWRLGTDGHFWDAMLLGVACGLIAIVLMRGVTTTERLCRASGVDAALRPLAGSLLVGILALLVPHVLGPGHGAMALVLQAGWPIGLLAIVLAAKIAASAVSIGSGFRGGLFSTSLFLGTITGALIAELGVKAGVIQGGDVGMLSLVGMASFGAAVVGSPMTMALLAVEITENSSVVAPVLVGVVAATLTVRQLFGYSFAIWRFHLRGEAILGGEDIGWSRELIASDLMRRDVTVVPVSMPIVAFVKKYPAGTAKYVAAVDAKGAFVGFVDVANLHAERDKPIADGATRPTLAEALIHQDAWIHGSMSIDRLLPLFEQRETEILAVVELGDAPRILGLITEAFALRRYRLELEARQKEIFGT